ncbi:MAG: glutathione synthase [Polyangia bacterium]
MRLLAIIDPPHLLKPQSDTTVAILDEAVRRGHEVSICEINDLWLNGEPGADVRRVLATSRTTRPALTVSDERVPQPLSSFHSVLMRKDPPFDPIYLWATQILEHARGKTLLVNDPRGLREANEKLYIFHFPDLIPPTIVTRRLDEIRRFQEAQGGQLVLKPLDGFGGAAVFLLKQGDVNSNALLETSTLNGQRWVMAQRYLPEGKRGDKRILLLDGEPLGALLRVPAENDLRSNMAVGGAPAETTLTERDHEIIARVRPRLQKDGLHFVGLDVIGGYLSEVNVTSPTGIQAINRLSGSRLETHILDWLERRAPHSA